MLNIAPALYGQSSKYIQVWLYIFNEVAKGNNKIMVKNVIEDCNVTRHGLYNILNRGVMLFNQHNILISIYRERITDNQFNIILNPINQINETIATAVSELNKQQTTNNISQTKKQQVKKNVSSIYQVEINNIITYLNEQTKKGYRTDTPSTVQLISNKLKSGFTIEQFKYVIDVKASQWLNTDNDKFLRPETLFGNKFEGYLNETINTTKQNSVNQTRFRNAEESINRDW